MILTEEEMEDLARGVVMDIERAMENIQELWPEDAEAIFDELARQVNVMLEER